MELTVDNCYGLCQFLEWLSCSGCHGFMVVTSWWLLIYNLLFQSFDVVTKDFHCGQLQRGLSVRSEITVCCRRFGFCWVETAGRGWYNNCQFLCKYWNLYCSEVCMTFISCFLLWDLCCERLDNYLPLTSRDVQLILQHLGACYLVTVCVKSFFHSK